MTSTCRNTARALVAILGLALALLFTQTAAFAKKPLPPPEWQAPPAALVDNPAPAAASADSTHALASLITKTMANDFSWQTRLTGLLLGLVIGGLVGAFFSQRLRAFRRALVIALLTTCLFSMASAGVIFNDLTSTIVGLLVGGIGAWLLLRVAASEDDDTTLGSARWADEHELRAHGVIGDDSAKGTTSEAGARGLFLGLYQTGRRALRMYYAGDRHLMTIAPNRSGKGATAIVSNLLTYLGSTLVIDPKGENAMMTAARRGAGTDTIPGMGQEVHILDPWNIAKVPGLAPSGFNPIDWIVGDPDNATENAMLLADSIAPGRDDKNPFWDDEARALATGLVLYVAFDPAEEGQRTLGRVRDIIVLDEEALAIVLGNMAQTPHPVARSTAARTSTKDEKLRSNVLTTLQAHTHFLDSPVIRESLSRSDFKFEDMKSSPMTVYLVLPADRLDAFGRWLRVLVQQAITVNARNIELKPERPILFILDEMAALGRLAMVERAFGLMAGFGIQLWGIFQDTAQAKRIYGDGWETFIGNAGVIQYFGSRDHTTAEYFSKLCGVTTIVKFSLTSMLVKPFSIIGRLFGKGSELQPQSTTKDILQRQLAFPDELMRLREPAELVFITGCNPIMGRKIAWYKDPERQHLGRNLHSPAVTPAPQPLAPTKYTPAAEPAHNAPKGTRPESEPAFSYKT